MKRLIVIIGLIIIIYAACAFASVSVDHNVMLTLEGGRLEVSASNEATSLTDQTFSGDGWDISFVMDEGDGNGANGRKVAFKFQRIGKSKVMKKVANGNGNGNGHNGNGDEMKYFAVTKDNLPTTILTTVLGMIKDEQGNQEHAKASYTFATNGADLAIKAANGEVNGVKGTLIGSVISGP
jgi:hypothetical protein